MARSFSPATAEQVVVVVDAVVIHQRPTPIEFVAEFSDLSKDQAERALKLAVDLALLLENSGNYEVHSPLCRLIATPDQMKKAALLRIMLNSYEPFILFRERLVATDTPATAAQQTKIVLDLDAHREDIKDTLISLGTYSHALITEGGGHYHLYSGTSDNSLEVLADACNDATAAESRIREQLGPDAVALVSREEVILPLTNALIRARTSDPRGAVVSAGNAVESYLNALALRLTVSLSGATGINGKLDKFTTANQMPKKLAQVGKYIGNVRNAADHGTDSDVGASWAIRSSTGLEIVFVACSFIAANTAREKSKPPEI
jgi:hypothetical protein